MVKRHLTKMQQMKKRERTSRMTTTAITSPLEDLGTGVMPKRAVVAGRQRL